MRIRGNIFLFMSGAKKLRAAMSSIVIAAVMKFRSVEENKYQEMGGVDIWRVRKMSHAWQRDATFGRVVLNLTHGLSRGLHVGGFRMISNEPWTKAFVQSPLLL